MAILYVEPSKSQKTVKRNNHPRVINILKESVSIISITNRILDLEVDLTFDDLIASVPVIKKQLVNLIIDIRLYNFELLFWSLILLIPKTLTFSTLFALQKLDSG